jgi:hypothetical protein
MTGLVRARPLLGGGDNRASADEPFRIVRVDPTNGAAGVFRDAPVVVSFSHPLDVASLAGESLRVEEAGHALAGEWRLSPDGAVAMWIATTLLQPGREHVVVASGLKDRHGREVPRHESRFVPGDLTFEDLPG